MESLIVFILLSIIGSILSDISPWVLQDANICFGARDNNFGSFHLHQDGVLAGLKLIHRTGHVSCDISVPQKASHWGCNGPASESWGRNSVSVFITDEKNAVIFPKGIVRSGGFYSIPVFNAMTNVIAFTDYATPVYVTAGTELRLWYGEDLFGLSEDNNGGVSCAEVYAKFV